MQEKVSFQTRSVVSLFVVRLFVVSLFVVSLFVVSLFVVSLFVVSLFVASLFVVSLSCSRRSCIFGDTPATGEWLRVDAGWELELGKAFFLWTKLIEEAVSN